MEDKVISPEKAEEAKLKARYPNMGAKPGGSDFLRKRLQKGVGVWNKPNQVQLAASFVAIVLQHPLSFCLCSKSILTLGITTWPRQKWRINSCHLRQQRRLRSRGATSQHLRICLKERLPLWPASWLVDVFIFIVLFTVLFPYFIATCQFHFGCIYFSVLYVYPQNMICIKPNSR